MVFARKSKICINNVARLMWPTWTGYTGAYYYVLTSACGRMVKTRSHGRPNSSCFLGKLPQQGPRKRIRCVWGTARGALLTSDRGFPRKFAHVPRIRTTTETSACPLSNRQYQATGRTAIWQFGVEFRIRNRANLTSLQLNWQILYERDPGINWISV